MKRSVGMNCRAREPIPYGPSAVQSGVGVAVRRENVPHQGTQRQDTRVCKVLTDEQVALRWRQWLSRRQDAHRVRGGSDDDWNARFRRAQREEKRVIAGPLNPRVSA